ncbi:MAG TPA: glycoside hydrolase family 18 protein [Candidatus Sulfotelmatobacter sp.]|jgi:chitinase|nr:glycoside hydrolase family 18 protein [Candidatus Sulfotelmatobacter sp.]
MVSRSFDSTRFVSILTLLIASLILFLPAARAQYANGLTKRVVGDYGYWSKYDNPPYSAAQIPFNMLTHINHSGVGFDAYGNLSVPDGFIEPELNNSAHAAGVKVLLLLGGNFNGLEITGAAQTLVDNIAAMETEYQYDGVDLDWEYPETTADRAMLVQLVAMLRASNPNYVISIDAAPWGGYGYDIGALKHTLDYVNVMMYDCAGPWTAHGQLNAAIFWDPRDPAPWECQPGGSDQGAAEIFLKGLPPKQINMGTPFYGYYYNDITKEFGLCPDTAWTPDQNCDQAVFTGNYGPTFKPLINKNGWHTVRDPIAMVPYMLRDDGSDGYITYDDATSTYYRIFYCDWTLGLGGTFMWSLDADYDGHSQDLMVAMYNASVSSK